MSDTDKTFRIIDLDKFNETFGREIELSSVALGGEIISVSDEFFAEAVNLIKVEAAPSLKGQFGPKGALYSGWESRRHNPTFDWVIIKLGAPGRISGFDIDTSHFSGNEAPEASVQVLFDVSGPKVTPDDSRWKETLPRVPLGPNSRHLFKLENTSDSAYNYVKLKMYPDGGIARFRVYGLVEPVFPKEQSTPMDLAHVFSGGRVVKVSDQHFGQGANLLLPGRGKDMGDGWETRRSRKKGHTDWVIIKLGASGYLDHTEIDTAHFMGNYPESCEIHGLYTDEIVPDPSSENWLLVLPRTKVGPHRRHFFQLHSTHQKISHIRLTIFPDGGVKRIRIIGRRALASNGATATPSSFGDAHLLSSSTSGHDNTPQDDLWTSSLSQSIPVLPLTAAAFAPFGQVIEAHMSPSSTPQGILVTGANQNTALKFHALAPILSTYPPEVAQRAKSAISVYRCKGLTKQEWIADEGGWKIKLLERHPYTNQAFVPMGVGLGSSVAGGSETRKEDDALDSPGRAYLVVVALSKADGKPDLSTIRAFIAGAGQGIMYNMAVWHHPMVALEKTIDFSCVETQLGDGSTLDCEIIELDPSQGLPRIVFPKVL